MQKTEYEATESVWPLQTRISARKKHSSLSASPSHYRHNQNSFANRAKLSS